METKKNPGKDIHRQRGIFFLIGICVSLGLMITAFQWTTEVIPIDVDVRDLDADMVLYSVPITTHPEVEQPKPGTIPKKQASAVVIIESKDSAEPESDYPFLDEPESPSDTVEFALAQPEAEESEGIVVFPEKYPVPVGGYENFYKVVSQNLKYPRQAQRTQVEGRVFIQFTVRKDGTVADLTVLKGIGFGCDEEALRVLALPKWEPGKQRGKPVHVKMVQPLVFKMP